MKLVVGAGDRPFERQVLRTFVAAMLTTALAACGGSSETGIEGPQDADSSRDSSIDSGHHEDVRADEMTLDASFDSLTADVPEDLSSGKGSDAPDVVDALQDSSAPADSEAAADARPEEHDAQVFADSSLDGPPDVGVDSGRDGAVDSETGTDSAVDSGTEGGTEGAADGSDDASEASDAAEAGCTRSVVGVCGRFTDGIHCATSNGIDSFNTPSTWSPAFANADGGIPGAEYWRTIQFPDVTGDGKADVCSRTANGVYCGVSNGTSSFASTTQWSNNFTDAFGWNGGPQYWATIQFPDVDGDGKADVCGRGGAGIYCGISNGVSGFSNLSLWDSNPSDGNGWGSSAAYWGTIQFPDVDGDGKADYCGRGSAGVWCALSNGTSFTADALWSNFFSDANAWGNKVYWGTIQFPDVDGDGKADVCARASIGIYCGLSNGVDGFGAPTRWSDNFQDSYGWNGGPQYWGTIQFPDIDGDGKADVCGRGGAGILCGISNGSTAFSALTTWNGDPSDAHGWNSGPEYWGTIQFPDVNGDGKADYCGRGGGGIRCAISNGSTGFTSDSVWSGLFSNANTWQTDPSYWCTIQFPMIDRGTCPLQRSWSPMPWRSSGLLPR